MDKKFSIRQFPSPEHPYIVFPQKNLAVLDISRFTFCKVDYQVKVTNYLRHETIPTVIIMITQAYTQ